MDTATITCPNCHTSFPLTAAIEQPIVDKLKSQLEADFRKRADAQNADTAKRQKELEDKEKQLLTQGEKLRREKAEADAALESRLAEAKKVLQADLDKKAREGVAVELQELKERLDAKEQALAKSQASELALRKAKQQLDDDRANFELEKQRTLDAERQKIRSEATKAATDALSPQLQSLQADLATKDKRLVESQKQELELRKQKAEFEEQKKAFDLEVARRADAARTDMAKQKDEEFRLKEAENAKKLADMTRQIDELKRKAEQGSEQSQGEILEVDLEAALERAFPMDEVQPVPKGTLGADVLHLVHDERALLCGTIVWESKRTKAWSDGWLQKLKDDKLAAKAQIAVIVTATLPKELSSFDCRDGVWIVTPALALPLASALRMTLMESASSKRAVEGRHDKMAAVYDYLSGPEFKSRVTAIVETFTAMKSDLEAEKKAMLKIWAKREKQIERIVTNTAGLHGELQGIIGQSLPTIEALEIESIAKLPPGEDS
jgi:hypothetical protein